MRVTFNDLAERELNDAIQYYEREQTGLGAAFLAEVRRCTFAIVDYPEAGAKVHGAIRRRLCERFPYALLYERRHEEIRMLGVMKLRRRGRGSSRALGRRTTDFSEDGRSRRGFRSRTR